MDIERTFSRAAAGALVLASLVCVLTVTSAAQAEVRRYALIIGTNLGEPEETRLQYAERDARRVSDVLGRLGGIPEENRVLLLDATSSVVERVITDFNARIRAFETQDPSSETLLFIFYSGHADSNSMHLRGTRLSFKRMRALLGESPADLRVFVIDACRSGEVTRVKGAAPAQPFRIDAKERLSGEGMAIITSSAAGEDAQESDRLKGSFFTHHFVSGLLGAADVSKDRRVTLGEAYQYAYSETLRSTSKARFVQHPTYAFQIRGRQDVVLTSLDGRARGMGTMEIIDPGAYLVFRGGEKGPLVAEVAVESHSEILLEPGKYLIRHREEGVIHQMLTRVHEKQKVVVAIDEMQRVPYGKMVRKGMSDETHSAWGLTSALGFGGEVLPGTGNLAFAALGLKLDLEPITLEFRTRAGLSEADNSFLVLRQRVLGLDVGALKLFDLGEFSMGLGLRLGADMVSQVFETNGEAPDRFSFVGRGAAVAHLSWTLLPWLSIYLEGGAEATLAQTQDESGTQSWGAHLFPYGMTGVAVYVH